MVADRLFSFASLRTVAALRAVVLTVVLVAVLDSGTFAQELEFANEAYEVFADLDAEVLADQSEFLSPEAAKFDQWEGLIDQSPAQMTEQELLPFDWIRHFGFKHSSTHGRNVGRGIPLEGTSWLNRPFHVDWFLGPLLGDDLISNRVSQDNVLFGGLRFGFDFDYFWGTEWRFAWADPRASFATPSEAPNDVRFVVSDIDVLYYPWGDSKVRPYLLWGLGVTQLGFVDDTGFSRHATLVTMPFGAGVQYHQWPWLVWRLEILDNLAFGADQISTMNNVSLSVGMEWRLGARPASYWPWRTSRKIW
jgi:hypothetical protein